ncbi:thymidine kinase 2, mitochondrial-like isoform X2 [Liolophura sinensis]|uniref:thymidine kinase 2, mitochondrial-like isoform X2 n=1 Tax=Liolophura sinensis TaxID=3198878 RepID=UPI003158267F
MALRRVKLTNQTRVLFYIRGLLAGIPISAKTPKQALMELKTAPNIVKKGLKIARLEEGKKSFTIAVEGNIGSGKTTLLEYFKSSPNVEAIREPLEQWTNVQGHNALGLLYQDPSRWSFSFNMYATLTRVQMHTKQSEKPIKMLERTLHSTRYCFVENDFRNKTINGLEYAVVTEWFNWLTASQKINIDLIVYLQCNPEVCFKRIKKRDRREEDGVPKKLIEDLHNLHEEWLVEQKYFKAPAPVLILDANQDYEDLVKDYDLKRQKILCGYS